jgi:hypothetical protein
MEGFEIGNKTLGVYQDGFILEDEGGDNEVYPPRKIGGNE